MINRRGFLAGAAGLGLGHTPFGQGIDFLFGREHKKSRRRWNELTDLDAILHKDPPVMREVARAYIRRATRQAVKGRPLTGTYYWAPVPMRLSGSIGTAFRKRAGQESSGPFSSFSTAGCLARTTHTSGSTSWTR